MITFKRSDILFYASILLIKDTTILGNFDIG
jgi:hypothetical protein